MKNNAGGSNTALRNVAGWLVVAFISVALLVLAEIALRYADYGYPTSYFIPETVNGQSMLATNPRFVHRFVPPALARAGMKNLITKEKPANTYRIFILGSSAALGAPNPAHGAGHLLEIMLDRSLPGMDVEVINLAMSGVNSHVMRAAAQEAAGLHPDLFIVYMGNNEATGPFGAGTVSTPVVSDLRAVRFNLWMRTLRLGQWADSMRQRFGMGYTAPAAYLGHEMFLEHQVRATDPALETTYRFYKENLNDICALASDIGTPVLLCTLAENLRDFAPFASLNDPTLMPQTLAEWQRHFATGVDAQARNDVAAALHAYTQAAAIDGTHAELIYRFALCRLAQGQSAEAQADFARARDLDTLRFRADARINAIIRDFAQRSIVTLVDVEAAFAKQSPDGSPGESLLYDHCHFTFSGNYALAVTWMDAILHQLPTPWRPVGHASATIPAESECAAMVGRNPITDRDDLAAILTICSRPPFSQRFGYDAWLARFTQYKADADARATAETMRTYVQPLRDAVQSRPHDWMLLRNAANAYELAGETQEAIVTWERAVELMPIDAALRLGLARALLKAKEFERAVVAFQGAIERSPNDAHAHWDLAKSLDGAGRPEEALAEYEQFVALLPTKGYSYWQLAEALVRAGRVDEAEATYRRGIAADPTNGTLHYYLGKLYEQKHEIARAVQEYQTGLQKTPDDAGLKAALSGVQKQQ